MMDNKRLNELKSNSRKVILYELMTSSLKESLSPQDIAFYDLESDCYQVAVCEISCPHEEDSGLYGRSLPLQQYIEGHYPYIESITVRGYSIYILKKRIDPENLTELTSSLNRVLLPETSGSDSYFLAYGRAVTSLDLLHLSYKDALFAFEHRFFCKPGQHILGCDNIERQSPPPNDFRHLNEEVLSKYGNRLIKYIHSHNTGMISRALTELSDMLYKATDDTGMARLFLRDLYCLIRGSVQWDYSDITIPCDDNNLASRRISQCLFLYQASAYLYEQFTVMVHATDNLSRETILNNVLSYINRNYRYPLRLETIASMFGYNSAYLGKIFKKNIGESFNTYVDYQRIEYAKKLLRESKLKVYEIAEQSGYGNVDYFHKKFKKYAGLSPAEYRRQTKR